MAYDEIRRRAVMLFGVPGATWEWDGSQWIEREPARRPPPRFDGYAMARDSARQNIVLFGGTLLPVGYRGDTWTWDGRDWIEHFPAVTPPARGAHAMAYDSARQRVVMYGGWGTTDTWEWDGASWAQCVSATEPGPRGWHAMAYDAARQRIVLFGGQRSGLGGRLADTWEWDGSRWKQLSPATSPSPRSGHGMAYDAARQQIVLFGGFDGGGSASSETWEWDGTNWTQRFPGSGPRGLTRPVMTRDAHGRALLFSGAPSHTPVEQGEAGSTWVWTGSDWIPTGPVTPVERSTVLAYDRVRKRTVLFGGVRQGTVMSDTWEWTGSAWLRRSPAVSPGPRAGHAMAHHDARGVTLLFGGGARPTGGPAETWLWDGVNWAVQPSSSTPGARAGLAMAYDAHRQRVVLFGGVGSAGLDDTWEWDGSSWIQRNLVLRPPARSGHAMVYDRFRRETILFGGLGSGFLGDTWGWDGTAWSQHAPATSPPARASHAMAYDESRQRVVLFGGARGSTSAWGDTWQYDGVRWTPLPVTAGPAPRKAAGMVHDVANEQAVLFGGIAPTGALPVVFGDSWVLGRRVAAESREYGGPGCVGSARPAALVGFGRGVLGGRLGLDLMHAPAQAPGALLLSTSSSSLRLGGCTLLVNSPWVAGSVLTDATGFAALAYSVPRGSSLAGLSLFWQYVVLDPRGSLILTNGLRTRLGE